MNKPIQLVVNILFFVLLKSFLASGQINLWEGTIDDNVQGVAGLYACDLDSDIDIDVLEPVLRIIKLSGGAMMVENQLLGPKL